MIIFINGAFGSGKTTVAQQLEKHLSNSLLFDPEEVGYFLRKVLKLVDDPDDFQHYHMWRSLVVTTTQLLQENYGRILIMPMTIWHLPYFEGVVGKLRQIEPDFHHFCLTASIATIQERLERRGEKPGGWSWERAERCCEAFQSPVFEKRIPTDTASPEDITMTILTALNAAATPPALRL